MGAISSSNRQRRSALSLLFGLLLAGPSCSDTTNVTAIPRAKGCEVEADCDKGLTCTKRESALGGLCHQDCTSSGNCEIGDRCVHADEDKNGSTVCQPATESLCRYDSDCFVPLKCGPDQQCRDACKNDYDCIKPQLCTNQHFCAEPYEVDGDKNLIVHIDVNAGGEGGGTSMPGLAGTGGVSGGGATSSVAGAGATETGGVGPGDGGESGQGGAAQGGSGGSGGSGPRPNPCEFDTSGCNPLTVVVAGNGTGSVKSDPLGLDCGNTCTFPFPVARAVVLSAFADEGSVFNGWSGGGCTGDRTCIVTPNAAPTITATFSSLGGTVVWMKTVQSLTSGDAVYDPEGNVIITGSNTTQVDLGAPSPFEPGTFVVKYTPDGKYNWDRRLAGTATQSIVTTDSVGDVLFVGHGGLSLGAGSEQLACAGNALLLASFAANGTRLGGRCYDPVTEAFPFLATRDGDYVGAATFPDARAGAQILEFFRLHGNDADVTWSQGNVALVHVHWDGLALDHEDNVFVGGWTQSGDFGGGPIAVAGGYDGFIMKRTSAGAFSWIRTFGGTQDDLVLGVETDADGNVAFTGRFRGQVEFPGRPPFTSQGGDDIIIGKYSSDGDPIWVKTFGTPQDEQGEEIVVLPNGDFLVAGSAHSSLVFEGAPLIAPGKGDAFLVQLSGDDGRPVWSKGYGSPEDDNFGRMFVNADSELLFAFGAGGSVDFGDGPTPSGGTMFVKLKLPDLSQ